MNELEKAFLSTLNFRLHIFPEEFYQYAQAIRSRLSLLKDLYNAQHGSLEEVSSKSISPPLLPFGALIALSKLSKGYPFPTGRSLPGPGMRVGIFLVSWTS